VILLSADGVEWSRVGSFIAPGNGGIGGLIAPPLMSLSYDNGLFVRESNGYQGGGGSAF
jgi:hypothetical protein